MKIKLMDNQEYSISDIQTKDNLLEISFSDKSCEELATIFSHKALLHTINVLDGSGNIASVINDFVILTKVELIGITRIVSIIREADDTQERIGNTELLLEEAQAEIDTLLDGMDFILMELVPSMMQ